MKLSNIVNGMTVKNYKAMCELLEEPVKVGKSKQLQIKDWDRFFTYEKQGNKFANIQLREEVKKKEDNKTSKLASLLFDSLLEVIYEYDSCATDYEKKRVVFISNYNISRSLGLINKNFFHEKDKATQKFYNMAFGSIKESIRNVVRKEDKWNKLGVSIKTCCKVFILNEGVRDATKEEELAIRNIERKIIAEQMVSRDFKQTVIDNAGIKGLCDYTRGFKALYSLSKLKEAVESIAYGDSRIKLNALIQHDLVKKLTKALEKEKQNTKMLIGEDKPIVLFNIEENVKKYITITFSDLIVEEEIKEDEIELEELPEDVKELMIQMAKMEVDEKERYIKAAKEMGMTKEEIECMLKWFKYKIDNRTPEYEEALGHCIDMDLNPIEYYSVEQQVHWDEAKKYWKKKLDEEYEKLVKDTDN